MFVRRRPLLRAAVVGGGAYVAGRKMSQHSAQEAEQEERIGALEQEQQAAPGAGGTTPAQSGPSMADQLKQISALHDQGVLSDEEFAAAKSKLLGI